MKRVLRFLVIATMVVSFNSLEAQVKSPKGNAQITKDGVEISIDYSRPYKKGRVIFGGLCLIINTGEQVPI